MTLTAAILLILVADIALIAGLAWVMSRPAKLTPHVRVPRPQQPHTRRSRVWRPASPQTGSRRVLSGRNPQRTARVS